MTCTFFQTEIEAAFQVTNEIINELTVGRSIADNGVLAFFHMSAVECRTFRSRTFRPRTFRPGPLGHGCFGHGKCQRWTFRPKTINCGLGCVHA